jgi:hypothetical protein
MKSSPSRFLSTASTLLLLLPAVFSALLLPAQTRPEEAERLLKFTNQTRLAQGLGMVGWDPALAAAALQHCQRMAQEAEISHQYNGEPELSQRASQAGARFSLIEENIATGPSAQRIHIAWMHSPGHRANLLHPGIDRVGIAVIEVRGMLYAAADYAHGVVLLAREEAEAQVAALLRARGFQILAETADARVACEQDRARPLLRGEHPGVIFRWEDGGLNHLPSELATYLNSGHYRRAAVGNCPADGEGGPFTVYRMAVLLFN